MNLFDIIPANFFNLLSSQSNGQIYSGALLSIYNEYEHEISYRIPRERIREAVAIYLLDNHVHIDDPDIQNEASTGDIASAILRKFSSPEVGWLTDEIDDVTYGHNIVMTEAGIRLAEFLEQLMKPERVEFSSFIFDIYNRLENENQWRDNPYVNALRAVFKNARSLSHALKQLSTFIRDIISRMTKEESMESLTENILSYLSGDFIKEYARLNKQQNIHIYRTVIIRKLQKMEDSKTIRQKLIENCMREEDIDEDAAQNLIADYFSLTKKFLKEDYDRIMHEIQHKITVYLQVAVGRARFLQNRDPNTRGYVEQTLKYLVDQTEELGMKDLVPQDIQNLFALETYDFINLSSLHYPGKARTIKKSEEADYVTISDKEMAEAMQRQKEAAYNPYSKDQMRQYLQSQMKGADSITSDQLPMERQDQLLAALSSVAYGRENGFDLELLDGYHESHNLRLRRVLIRRENE